jgi:hypothetical protein
VAQTLASVLKRSEAANADHLVAAYRAAPPMPARLALLEVMGQTSSQLALPLLRAALADPAPEIARAAILALSEWATPAPLPDLAALARTQANPALQVLALRGYLKLLALPGRPAAETAALLADAMSLARQPAEKKTILSMLAGVPSTESLKLARAATEDKEVAAEAAAAVEKINSLIKFQ